jgi:hypothetical protein
MTDYGAVKKKGDRAKKRALIVALVALAAAGVAFLLWSNRDSRERAIATSSAEVNAHAIVGPPCEAGTAAGKLGRGDQWMTVPFNQIEFGRRIGHADCGVAQDDSKSGYKSVCQFSSPAEIKVVTKDGAAHYFDVGLGQKATVTVTDTAVTCVKAASKF